MLARKVMVRLAAALRCSELLTLQKFCRNKERATSRQNCCLAALLQQSLLLRDSQDEGAAGSTARAAKITRVSARSIDRHPCCSCCGDYGSRNRGLQVLTARGSRA